MERAAGLYQRIVSLSVIILGFFAAYLAATIVFQAISKIPPWVDGSPVDIMTGSMIWTCCIIALMMAILTHHQAWLSMIWLGGSAALGLVALDELFAMHEHAAKIRDDDDPKIVMALIAGVGLYVLVKAQQVTGRPLYLLIAGFVVHCLYLLSDLGDGDFFDVTLGNPDALRVIEECLEFTAMSFYLAAFVLILLQTLSPRAAPDRGGEVVA